MDHQINVFRLCRAVHLTVEPLLREGEPSVLAALRVVVPNPDRARRLVRAA